MRFICVASAHLRWVVFPKILEYSAVGLMELFCPSRLVLEINGARTDFIDSEMPQLSGRRRDSKEIRDG
jgi:hypothetical protein